MSSAAAWLSSAAFCISVTALLSNLVVLWLKWPRIVVEVAVRNGALLERSPDHEEVNDDEDHDDEDHIVLTVINNGSEAITIKSVGLTSPARMTGHRLDYLDTWHTSQTPALPTAQGARQSVLLPARVEGHACAVFEYTHDALAQLPVGLAYHGYAKRYRAMRWRPNHPLVHETTSLQSVTRRATGVRSRELVRAESGAHRSAGTTPASHIHHSIDPRESS